MLVYSIFLPLKRDNLWFLAGCLIYLIGLVIFFIAIVNIATTPFGKPFTKGMYHVSRHPMDLSEIITFLGISMASTSSPFLLLTIVLMVLENTMLIAEERGCLQTFGDEYQEYMNKTAR